MLGLFRLLFIVASMDFSSPPNEWGRWLKRIGIVKLLMFGCVAYDQHWYSTLLAEFMHITCGYLLFHK